MTDEAPATVYGKEHALEKLRERRANKPEQINNASLPAGSDMYYYCISCGHEAAVLSEAHTTIPPNLCKECRALKDLDWLNE